MSTQEDDEVQNERQAVETYLKFNELEDILNGILNELVTERPQDPYLALSNILVDYSRESRKIIDVKASEVLGPTGCSLQVDVRTTKGLFSATMGGYGYDDDPTRHFGKGYGKVINALNALIVPKLKGMDPADQAGVDKVLSEESTLSEAARLAVSMAVCRAGAKQANQEVFQYIAEMADNYNVCTPVPHVCVLEGGRSASNKLVVKSVVIMPHGASSFEEAFELTLQVQKKLEAELKAKNDVNFGRQGGLAPAIGGMDEALGMVRQAIKAVGLEGKVAFGLDVSAQDFAESVRRSGEDDAVYNMSAWDPQANPPNIKKKDELLDMFTELLVSQPFVSVSEPFHPNQRSYYGRLNENFKQFVQGAKGDTLDAYRMHSDGVGGDKDCVMQIVGDASLKTEADIEEANTKKTMNTVRVTLRKAGTVSSLIKLVQKAQAVGFGVVVATDGRDHSDALDTFAAHAAVGLRAGQVDFGSLQMPLEKYNELVRIEKLGGVSYAAGSFRTFH